MPRHCSTDPGVTCQSQCCCVSSPLRSTSQTCAHLSHSRNTKKNAALMRAGFICTLHLFPFRKRMLRLKRISDKTSPLKHTAVAHYNSQHKLIFKKKGKVIFQSLGNLFESRDEAQQHYKGHPPKEVTSIIPSDTLQEKALPYEDQGNSSKFPLLYHIRHECFV